MPPEALALALGAAALHALWNLLLAREEDTEAATAIALLTVVIVLILPAALTWRAEAAAVPYVVGSAALELAYFALLAGAYRRHELSLVYPVARGLAPVLALAFVIAAGGALPSGLGIAGVVAIAVGVLLIRGLRGSLGGLAVGVVIASTIAGYTVLDRHGIQHAAAMPYLLLVLVGPALLYPLAALGERAGGCGRTRDERGDRDGAGGHRARREGWPYPPGRSRPRRCRRCGSRPLLARPIKGYFWIP